MKIQLEIIVMPKTNNLSGWRWQKYSVRLEYPPNGENIELTLKNANNEETVSGNFQIKSSTKKSGVLLLKTAHTVVSDNFYLFAEQYCQKIDNRQI